MGADSFRAFGSGAVLGRAHEWLKRMREIFLSTGWDCPVMCTGGWEPIAFFTPKTPWPGCSAECTSQHEGTGCQKSACNDPNQNPQRLFKGGVMENMIYK